MSIRDKVTIVRCKLNQYKTPLYSFDTKGIYIRCKDCREMRDGSWKRGVYHLIPWSIIFRQIIGIWDSDKEVNFGTIAFSSGGDSTGDEAAELDNRSGGDGDTGGQLDGKSSELSNLPSITTSDSS